jgi:hypothetical protein
VGPTDSKGFVSLNVPGRFATNDAGFRTNLRVVALPYRRVIDHPCLMHHLSRFCFDVCETIKQQRSGGVTRILSFSAVVLI